MLVWLTLSIAFSLCALTILGVVAMGRAERRARRALYAALGVGEAEIRALMSYKGSVSTQMALVRMSSIIVGSRPDEIRGRGDDLHKSARRSFQYTRALNGTRAVAPKRTLLAVPDRNSAQDRREPS